MNSGLMLQTSRHAKAVQFECGPARRAQIIDIPLPPEFISVFGHLNQLVDVQRFSAHLGLACWLHLLFPRTPMGHQGTKSVHEVTEPRLKAR